MNRVGVDLGGTKIEAVALAPGGEIAARVREPAPQGDYAETLEAIAAIIGRIEAMAGPAASIGIGAPGSVSPANGLHRNSNSTWINGRPFAADLEARLGRPIRIANDANCFALSEAVDGAGAAAASVFGVIVGTGTGGGLVIDRRIVAGANGIGGEWGHIPLPWPSAEELPGPACYCGKNGCMETWVSGPGFAADFRRITGRAVQPEAIAQAAAAGDVQAAAALDRLAERMARGLAVVINIADPSLIVLGGGLSNIAGLAAKVEHYLPAYCFSDRIVTRVVTAIHGDSGGVRGAAWLWGGP